MSFLDIVNPPTTRCVTMFRFRKNEQDEQILEKILLWIGRNLGLGLTRLLIFYRAALGVCSPHGFGNRHPSHFSAFRVTDCSLIRQRGRLLGFPPNVHRVHSIPDLERTDAVLPVSFTLENLGLRSIVPLTSRTPYLMDVFGCTTFHVHYPTTKLSHKLVSTIQPHVCKLARRQGFFTRGMRIWLSDHVRSLVFGW